VFVEEKEAIEFLALMVLFSI